MVEHRMVEVLYAGQTKPLWQCADHGPQCLFTEIVRAHFHQPPSLGQWVMMNGDDPNRTCKHGRHFGGHYCEYCEAERR